MKKLTEVSSILIAVLIFLGFWNLFFYYDYFDIDIYSYVTTGEIILSFLPVVKDALIILLIIILFLFLSFLFTISPYSSYKIKITENRVKRKTISDIKRILYSTKEYEGISFIEKVRLINSGLIEILRKYESILFFIPGFLIFFFTVIINPEYFLHNYLPGAIFYSFLFIGGFICLFDYLNDILIMYYKKNFIQYFLILIFFIMVVFLNTLSNYKEIFKIKNNLPKYLVSFRYNGTNYQTDSSYVFIGKTQNYIFTRELKTNTNKIFPMDKIENLEFKK